MWERGGGGDLLYAGEMMSLFCGEKGFLAHKLLHTRKKKHF